MEASGAINIGCHIACSFPCCKRTRVKSWSTEGVEETLDIFHIRTTPLKISLVIYTAEADH